MSSYYKHLRDFERSVSGLSQAMEGLHQQHTELKRQFRKYVMDHETFTRNVRTYLDELEHAETDHKDHLAPSSRKGQNDNELREKRSLDGAGE